MRQFSLLYGHAWRRLSRLDGVARGSDPRAVLVLGAIVFGVVGAVLAFILTIPVMVGFRLYMIDARPTLHEQAYFSALLIALALLLEWDALLPDATDRAVLGPLPVSRRKAAAAHAAALVALVGMLTVVVNLTSVIFVPVLDNTHEGFLLAVARQTAGVGITAVIALGAVLGLRALTLACAGLPGGRRLGTMAQLAALIAVLTALLVLPVVSTLNVAWRAWLESSPLPLAAWAAGLGTGAAAVFLWAGMWTFRGDQRPRGQPWAIGGSHPCAAVARFGRATLVRCARQRRVVGAWFALGAGVVLASAASLIWGFTAPTRAASVQVALSGPLVLMLFVLAGLRNSFAVPVELGANWVFRVCGSGQPGELAGAARRLMLEYLAVMLVATAGFGYWYLPLGATLEQVLFVGLTGAVWIQALTWNLRKIPFTCSRQAGGANLMYVWPIYALGFVLGGYLLAGWEQWLLGNGWGFVIVTALLAAALAWSEQARRKRPGWAYQFEDEPEPVVQTLLA